MSITRCNCSFCAGLVGSTSLVADAPATMSALAGFGLVDRPPHAGFMMAIGVAGSSTAATTAVGAVPTQQATTGTTGSTVVPSWVNGLTTATIRTDMTAADVNGVMTEAGLAQVFTDLAASLSTTKTTLTAAEYADLKTIAANLNNGMTASSYLTYVTNALVNGNAANASWTGGGAKPVALGNLAVGSSATQLTELTGKWFLGTDLPSSSVAMSGSASFSVSYSVVSKPLFAASGPSMNDINQGYLGDCYLLSSLAEVASQNASAISSMITNNGNNTYGVRFYYHGTAEYVTVNNDLANGGTEFNSGPDLWGSLIEQAYAQFQAIILDTGNSVNYGNSWSTIGNGGMPDWALEAITGAASITDFFANGSTWFSETLNSSMAITASSAGLSVATVMSSLVTDLGLGYDLVLASNTYAKDSSGRYTLIADHAMSIYGYDKTTGNLEIRNPWGSEPTGQYWDTTFEISLATLLSDGDSISVANLPGTTGGIVSNALVANAASLQANATVTGFTIADTMANVGAALAVLAGDTKLISIALTDSGKPSLSLTAAQLAADAGVLGKIASPYSLTVTAVSVATAASILANATVVAFTVADTAANVTAALSTLGGDGKLTGITFTDTSKPTLTLTYAQYSGSTATLAKIAGVYGLVVTGAPASAAAVLQAAGNVTTFTVADAAASVTTTLTALGGDSKLTAITLTDGTKPTMILTSAQYTADVSILAEITSAHNLTVTGATVASAPTLQAAAGVTSFAVTDTAAAITTARTALIADTKLSSITATGTSGGDTLNLAGLTVAATVGLGGDTASVSAGLSAPSLTFIGTPDAVTLGTGATTINYNFGPGDGIETIASFQFGLDHLMLGLNGAATSALHIANTTVGGAHALSVYTSADPTHGVILLGMSTSTTAASVLASHVTFSNGTAMIG